jgi:hypothetical protein
MRLILAPKSMKGIEEKLLKPRSKKLGQKYLWKSWKWKILQLKIGDDSTQKDSYIDTSHSLEDRGDLLLLSSLLYDMKHTPYLAK